ncbi:MULTISPECIES: hydrogen peroxide-dependent heme synthase [unclassified Microbacterium]|uniref:hydrogen peroxide-dependent heme synthase n=1 Tax=unclassified Microbacterium TaxID=2609290 RepID=UPI00214C51F2|nr:MULTISPECIES: hydrogen peroxide-dependent heme synthase [unclassified Microbacterium]MCR2783328.1 chlorite dismutase family protein [Microbacterium sp. zg.B96]MDL5351889.1 chlorite dismutase family protein [Microbacterium sp. zg-YB36]WIM15799.1 chlorite dismutase family protein [Microbacterium sp. zg-B96]
MSDTSFTLWSVLRRDPANPVTAQEATELEHLVADLAEGGTTVRGFYDVSGLRADADVMIWLHGPTADGLQRDLRRLRRTPLLQPLLPTWSAMGVHRDAEFNRAHVPGFLRGIAAKQWLTVYPFVRSFEWYLLPDEERRAMLADHGRKGAAFTGVTANTVASFALGDWEWILPMEADELTDLVDMMRELRYTEARRHVREEVPFFTGRLVAPAELVEVLR